ncbi:SH3 domain-containing protein [Streptomyces orinoci]|uniref:SH3 domain-containing protein n=1 Tax=Streptomyces orinoci TaxID=67339 RepID=A0ABV3JXC7_STRON|nr:SH3 domain-containing protein [Streptomyces orinoci]
MANEETVISDEATEAAGSAEGAEAAAPSAAAAGSVYYSLAPGYQVNVRSGPSTDHQVVRVLPEGTRIAIRCQTRGETVDGPCGTSDIWDNIGPGQYISDSYVKTGSSGYVTVGCS